MPKMPGWVYPLSFVFLIFVIYNDPGGAGELGNNFAGFIRDIAGSLGDFLDGLFDGEAENSNSDSLSPRTSADVSGASASTDGLDHSHDGG